MDHEEIINIIYGTTKTCSNTERYAYLYFKKFKEKCFKTIFSFKVNIQLSPEGEVNSGGYIPRREASRYIFTALHRP